MKVPQTFLSWIVYYNSNIWFWIVIPFFYLLQSDYADLNTEESIPKKLDIQKGTNANEQNHTPLIELSNNDRLLDLCGIDNNFSSQLCDDNKATDQKQINSLGQNARSSKISMAHKLKKKNKWTQKLIFLYQII